jgi:hypothetical protein
MPDKRERDFWWAFLEGRPKSEWDPQTRMKKKDSRKPKIRAFSDDESTHADEEPVLSQETWHINDEGEVELTSTKDPSELPLAPETPALTEMQETISSEWVPREPTPSLLRRIDHVSMLPLHSSLPFSLFLFSAYVDASSNVFYSLDHYPSPGPRISVKSHDRDACALDLWSFDSSG